MALIQEIQVKINGAKLADKIAKSLLSARISFDLEMSDAFHLTFEDADQELQENSIFDVGNKVEILMGTYKEFTSMMEGEIVQLRYQFETKQPVTLTVIGFDRMYKLGRTRKTRSFIKMKDSDIAAKLAQEVGLTPETDATSIQHPYLFQNNQTNLDFLKMRARRINYDVKVEGTKLLFKKSRIADRTSSVTLKWEENLVSFTPTIDATRMVEKVTVQGWDPTKKEAITASASAGSETLAIKGTVGTSRTKSKIKNGKAEVLKVDAPLASKAEAEAIAKARLQQLSMEYMRGEGSCIGDPSIKAGKIIKIDGIGKRISGEYYVSACEHLYSARGYRTHFAVKRNIEEAK